MNGQMEMDAAAVETAAVATQPHTQGQQIRQVQQVQQTQRARQAQEAHQAVDGGGGGMEDLAALRAALLKAYPRAVPELVSGGSVGEMLASLEGAQAAWERVAAAVALVSEPAAAGGGAARPPVVPAGAAPAAAVDPERLPANEKIRRGLMGRRG